jgi:CheY-like chemotaxis protein
LTPHIADIASDFPLSLILVEDNRVNQRVIVMMLEKLGYVNIRVASSGVECLQVLQEVQLAGPHCILMDLSLNGMNGLECCRQIRQSPMLNNPRPWIISQTANADSETRLLCEQAGMDDFLSKPIKLDVLQGALRNAYCRMGYSASDVPQVL